MKTNMIIKTILAALTAVTMLSACAGAPSGSSAGSTQGAESAESAAGTTDTAGSASVSSTIEKITSEVEKLTGEITAGTSESAQNETAEETEMSQDVKYIALTFDDGPNATTTNDVIDKLEKYDIVASFFLIGNNINDESAKAVKRAYDLGCEIDNHSRTHSNMTELSAEDIRAEFEYTDEKAYEITGEHTKFFRPPYISVHQIMFDNIDVPFIAGIGANDWEDRVTAEMRARMILKQAKDGDIILLHDAEGNSMTVEALDTIIPELQKQGYKFVTVTELFKIKGIEPDMEKVYTNVLQKNMYN